MKFVFYFAEKGYEMALAPAMIAGAAACGDEIVLKPNAEYRGPEFDGGIICGVTKREILWDHKAKGVPLIYEDKGYTRSRTQWKGLSLPTWWRMCWNAVHPTDYLMELDAPDDRLRRAGFGVSSLKSNPDGHIVLLGSSQKFHHTEGLPHPTEWATDIIRQIENLAPGRMCIYRPKPSWAAAERIEGAEFHHGQKTPVSDDLAGAFCSITYGSIACVDSILAGVPCIVLGNGVARPVSSRSMTCINAPLWSPPERLRQWLCNLSFCQFTPPEIESGFAWSTLREQMRYAF